MTNREEESKRIDNIIDTDSQAISKTEILKYSYTMGKFGFIFPKNVTNADFVVILHNTYMENKETIDGLKRAATIEEQEIDDFFGQFSRLFLERIFEYSGGKYLEQLKNDLVLRSASNEKESIKVKQIIQAYEEGLFYPCACAVTAMIEGTLGKATNSSDTRMYELIKSALEKSNHPEKEIVAENLKGFISVLSASSKFSDNKEPSFINRHWLLHGRSEKEVKKQDCLLLLNVYREILEFIQGPIIEET